MGFAGPVVGTVGTPRASYAPRHPPRPTRLPAPPPPHPATPRLKPEGGPIQAHSNGPIADLQLLLADIHGTDKFVQLLAGFRPSQGRAGRALGETTTNTTERLDPGLAGCPPRI